MTSENTTDTDSGFFIPTRYDEDLIAAGVWFEVVDENDTPWGKFKLRWYDKSNPEIKRAMEKARTKHAKNLRTNKADIDAIVFETFLDAIVDWEMKDAKGKKKPFTRDNVIAYFAIPQVKEFVYDKLLEFAGDVRNFNKADKDEVLGN